MTKTTRSIIAALLICGPGLIAWSQISIAPPPTTTSTSAPATTPATPALIDPSEPILPMAGKTPEPAATTPSTLPTAQSVLEGLLNEHPAAPVPTVADTNSALTLPVPGVAPNEPKAAKIREGQYIWNRVGRLIKDDKTGIYMFAFDADGKTMADPPMALLPSHLLQAMENASDKGARSVKFRVTGEVTEYHGKNYMLIRDMQAIQDLNQGIGK